MSKFLIIAEKPSLARNIISAIGTDSFKKSNGYYESPSYIVTWAFGHLFSLADMDEYIDDGTPDGKRPWNLDDLPFYPSKFQFVLKKDKGVKEQFNTICSLINKNEVSKIINAGDSDREGEIIIRIILRYAGCKKDVFRLWLPDQTPQTIKKALNDLPSDKDYENLANEGYARTFIDWLYGVNLTRYSTVRCGSLLRVGRVISPIVQAIYEREMAIRNFTPEKYFTVASREETKGEIIDLTSEKKFKANEQAEAQKYSDLLNEQKAYVKDVKKEEKTISPGKLYSLSKLQGVLGKRYNIPPYLSLEIVQDLYEKGYVTYPRTNTEYLATAEKEKVASLLKKISELGYNVRFKDSKTIFDDSKIESHSALTPTYKIPSKGELEGNALNVYKTIFDRFIAVFCAEACVAYHTEITVAIGSIEDIVIKGDVIKDQGWTKYDKYSGKDKVLPDLREGDSVNTRFVPEEKQTTPPSRYTTDTFYKYLKNPFRKEDATDEDEYKAMFSGVELGTEATRTAIIQNAIKTGYISLKDNKFYLEKGGEVYIDALNDLGLLLEKAKTAELGVALKDVYKGKNSVMQAIKIVEQEITNMINNSQSKTVSERVDSIGKCPKCGADVVDKPKSFSCINKDCGFALWKDNKYFASMHKKLDIKIAKSLLKDGKVYIKNLKSKNGNVFAATIHADFSDKYPQFSLEFNDDKSEKKSPTSVEKKDAGSSSKQPEQTKFVCPICGNPILKFDWGWGCSSRCGFRIGGTIASRKINDLIVKDLVEKRKTDFIEGFISKSGKEFKAKLVLKNNGNIEFSFE